MVTPPGGSEGLCAPPGVALPPHMEVEHLLTRLPLLDHLRDHTSHLIRECVSAPTVSDRQTFFSEGLTSMSKLGSIFLCPEMVMDGCLFSARADPISWKQRSQRLLPLLGRPRALVLVVLSPRGVLLTCSG